MFGLFGRLSVRNVRVGAWVRRASRIGRGRRLASAGERPKLSSRSDVVRRAGVAQSPQVTPGGYSHLLAGVNKCAVA